MNQIILFLFGVALVVLFLVGLAAKLSSAASGDHPTNVSDNS